MSKKSKKLDKKSKSSSSASSSSANFDAKTMAVIEHKGYAVANKLGEGAYGQVYKAVYRKTGKLSAVKVIRLEKMSQKSRQKLLPREIETLIQAKHENLIQVNDIFRSNHRLFIFMDFAANGDISGYMKKHRGIKETKLACKWFLQASSGLHFLHTELGTAHRDNKPDNILLDNHWVAKLSDFGFAKMCYDKDKQSVNLSSTFCGTKPYEAPQIIECKQYDPLKADMWSMGITLFVMLHDTLPFPYKDTKEMLHLISKYPQSVRDKMNRKLPEEAIKFQLAMLHPREADRASVSDLVENEWLRRASS